ncbi:MAG: hypothetical protein ISS19_18005 [Bacteroidales bacterium]|nr:hypothetical protein [Bacteroidales bacterium]
MKSLIFENFSDKDNISRKINHFNLTWTGNPNYPVIRLDVFEGNLSANKLYSKLGFSQAGKCRFPHQEMEFVCYEMKI